MLQKYKYKSCNMKKQDSSSLSPVPYFKSFENYGSQSLASTSAEVNIQKSFQWNQSLASQYSRYCHDTCTATHSIDVSKAFSDIFGCCSLLVLQDFPNLHLVKFTCQIS